MKRRMFFGLTLAPFFLAVRVSTTLPGVWFDGARDHMVRAAYFDNATISYEYPDLSLESTRRRFLKEK